MNTLIITDTDLQLINDCIKAVKAINFDKEKYNSLLSKLKQGKTLPIQNVRQSDSSNNLWDIEYSSHAEYCSGCNTDNLHTNIKTGKKSCACCGGVRHFA